MQNEAHNYDNLIIFYFSTLFKFLCSWDFLASQFWKLCYFIFVRTAGESEEAQQLSQLRILYESRGRRLEDLTAELEAFRQESSKERRMLKHHLSLAQGQLNLEKLYIVWVHYM